ncbi:hypothetical protein O6H91_Y111500 [Diphasiastrum complanatum]|nr:hypothetical protein O6H91_Y111500 [Diphasiastrum complanatum]
MNLKLNFQVLQNIWRRFISQENLTLTLRLLFMLESYYTIFYKRSQSQFHENIAEDMKRRLLDEGGPAILGIYGESGVGKTHVAQTVACDAEVQEQFLGGIIWLSFGQFPNIHDLQATLWSDSVSKSSFISAEDGLIKLKKKFAEGLPVLLIIDDLSERAHLDAVKILEGKDKGRMLVTSRKREVLEAEDIEVVFMDAMKEDDALALFFSSAGFEDQDKGSFLPLAVDMLQGCCKLPIVVQAVATSLYKERDIQTWQRAQNFLREGTFSEWENRVTDGTIAALDAERLVNNKEKGSAHSKSEHVVEDSQLHIANDITKDTSLEGMGNILQGLAWSFIALTSIHPLFQECFLDLAAYPEGEYVATENLETFWRYGNKILKDEVFLCLSLLQCRSMVEFKVDSKKSPWKLGQGISWKLPSKFHEFVTKKLLCDWKSYPSAQRQNLVQKQIRDASNLEADLKWLERIPKWKNAFNGQTEDDHGSKPSTETCSSERNTFCEPEVLSPSLSCIGNLNCSIEQSNAACQSENAQSEVMNLIEQHGSIGESIVTRKEVKERRQIRLDRLFLPDLKLDHIPVDSVDQFKRANILKLSLIGNDITRVKDNLQFPSLQIALMTNNKKLKRVFPPALHGMQHLLVLDLRGCSSLKELPVTVSSLQSLQLLDLRFCTNLCTLPKSIGSLRHLHQLKLSGCAAFTHLPRSVGWLQSLEVLEMVGCKQLRCLPSTIGRLSSLLILNLHGCSSLHTLPTSIDSLKRLYFLELSGCSNLEYVLSLFEKLRLLMDLQKSCLMAVPMGIWRMSNIETLSLSSLKNLTFLPSRISALHQLRNLSLSDCRSLEFLPEELGALSLLQELDLSHTALRKLPQSLGKLEELKHLYLQGCARLLSVPDSISQLSKLELLDLSACWDLVKVPDTFGGPGSFCELRELNMSGCSIKAFPPLSNDAFSKLKVLKLANCSNLYTLPSNFGILHSLEQINLEGCSSLTSLQGVGMGQLKSLAGLNLRNCTKLTLLPATELASLDSLKFLDVSGCSGLSPFPEVLLTCARLHSLKLVRWGALWH